jgi:hypothetical protein
VTDSRLVSVGPMIYKRQGYSLLPLLLLLLLLLDSGSRLDSSSITVGNNVGPIMGL